MKEGGPEHPPTPPQQESWSGLDYFTCSIGQLSLTARCFSSLYFGKRSIAQRKKDILA